MAEGLFERLLSENNFIVAYRRVASKKAIGGIDGVSVEAFGRRLHQNIRRLQREIREGCYVPHPVKAMHVPKFNEEDEWRELGLPVVADKVIQAAMLQVVEPLAERLFLDSSYGYRPGKGPHKAIRRAEHHLRYGGMQWAVHRDIDNFFDSLNHDRLLSQFSDLVKGDTRLIELVALWCRMGLVEKDGRWRNVQAGVRQGHIISPLLANLYLHPLDEFVTQHTWGWVRYADDFLLQCKSQEEAVDADKAVIDFLANPLGLKVNTDNNAISHIDQGFTFLGVHFQGEKRQIATSKIEKMKRKIAWVLSGKNMNTPEKIIDDLTEMAEGWRRYYGFLSPKEEFAQLDRLIEEGFCDLLTQCIRQGHWPNTPPEGLLLPKIEGEHDAQTGRKLLENIWKQASTAVKMEADPSLNQGVERKVARRRQRYLRQQGFKGELVVTTPGHFVGKRGERIIIRKQQQIIAEMPAIQLRGLTIAGRGVAISGDVIELCARRELHIHFIDELGRIFAVTGPPGGTAGDISLRQITLRDKEQGLYLAKAFVLGKIKNQFTLLKYYQKYRRNRERTFGKIFREKQPQMMDLIERVKQLRFGSEPQAFRQRLMGLEGVFGAIYWGLVKHLFRQEIDFPGRIRQGARDLINSLLNYGYGILYGRTFNAIIRAGLNPMAGFLHTYQPGKPILVHDMVEEFRALAVDRGVFSMLNRGEKLSQEEDGLLTSETKKKVAKSVIGRLAGEVHFQGRRLTLEETIQEQAYNVKKYLNGTCRYRPFLGRW